MQPEEIKQLIETTLKNSEVTVEGDGTHFSALVISDQFNGKSRIKRQQMVYDAVKQQLLSGTLHALSLKTLTPAEWEQIDLHEED